AAQVVGTAVRREQLLGGVGQRELGGGIGCPAGGAQQLGVLQEVRRGRRPAGDVRVVAQRRIQVSSRGGHLGAALLQRKVRRVDREAGGVLALRRAELTGLPGQFA